MCMCAMPFLVRKKSFHEHFHLGTWSLQVLLVGWVCLMCKKLGVRDKTDSNSFRKRTDIRKNTLHHNIIYNHISREREREWEWGRSWRSGRQRCFVKLCLNKHLRQIKVSPGFGWEALLCPCPHSQTKQNMFRSSLPNCGAEGCSAWRLAMSSGLPVLMNPSPSMQRMPVLTKTMLMIYHADSFPDWDKGS